ncbi:MAG: Holliday junction resolvase RuvX [Parcubacteria group bacterium]|nr:Holliday junction resolvase RuvX [Parcubacteria group bacterium]
MRILGIDYGDKKIGLAFGESDARLAIPLDVAPNKGEETIRIFAERAKVDDIDLIVVGVPLSTGGHHDSEQLKKTRTFIDALRLAVEIPVEEQDESFTTADSIRLQEEEGATADEDALAAMLIIKSYFDSI